MRRFAVAVLSAATLSACAGGVPAPSGAPSQVSYEPSVAATSAVGAAPSSPAPVTTTAAPSTPAESDLSELRRLGIDVNEGVLIDVADDGLSRYLQIGRNGVDFTGTTRTDSTMMALKAAPVREKNRVVIRPPFWNEDLGKGSCVADTAGAALTLETCQAGQVAQVWEVRPAGDSGQFELWGTHGAIRVENGRITTNGPGRTGLQTIPFAG